MSLTKRTFTNLTGTKTFVVNGSVSGATTSVSSIVFTASGWTFGLTGTINVYADGTKKSVSWTANKTETVLGTVYKIKMTSSAFTVSKPFFTLKLVRSSDSSTILEEKFSFLPTHDVSVNQELTYTACRAHNLMPDRKNVVLEILFPEKWPDTDENLFQNL